MTFVLLAALALGVGASPAAEKLPDLTDIGAKAAFNPPIAGTLSAESDVYDRIYNSGDVNRQCGAEALDSANDGMYYDMYCFQVDSWEPVQFVVDAAGTNIVDTVLTIYCDGFDPLNPANGVVAYDDDDGLGTLSAFTAADDIVLEPGQEYWLVISSYGGGMTGDYVVQPGDNIYDCGTVSREATSWGNVKGLYR